MPVKTRRHSALHELRPGPPSGTSALQNYPLSRTNSLPSGTALRDRSGSAPSVLRAAVVSMCSVLLLLVAAGCSSIRQAVQNRPCANAGLEHVEIDLDRHKLELLWKDSDGEPLLTLDRARAYVEARGDSVVALTNAGIYEPGFIPTGLFVQHGIERQPLNLRDGEGNFYLKPNGVFYLTATGARIAESSGFAMDAEELMLALQSGPLLLSRGIVHSAFRENSSNCRLRSGIGIRPDGLIVLAISRGAINFHDFARYFLEELGCTDALYLDGTISSLYAPAAGRLENTQHRYAGILAATVRVP